MNKLDKISLQLAEKICKKKFDEKFGDMDQYKNLDHDGAEELYMNQVQLWKEIGSTHLSEHSVVVLPPIKQALYYMCKDKIKFCMSKLLMMEE